MTITNPNSFFFSAPGSIMLLGEHTVLHGGQAIVAAINRRIKVSLTPRLDQQININSNRLGQYRTTLTDLTVVAPFEFVLTAISQFQTQLTSGFSLTIKSEFADNLGLGSSAAVTVATLGVIAKWLQLSLSPFDLHQQAKQVIVSVQGAGSGADAAASIFGGVVAYRQTPQDIQSLPLIPQISLIYSGYKTPTKTVIAQVAKKQIQWPQLYGHLYAAMDSCTQAAVIACQQQQWPQLGKLINIYQGLQEALGVSTPQINTLIAELRQQPNILGAKISGSGLGDCIWGLGELAAQTFPRNQQQRDANIQQIDVAICGAQDEQPPLTKAPSLKLK